MFSSLVYYFASTFVHDGIISIVAAAFVFQRLYTNSSMCPNSLTTATLYLTQASTNDSNIIFGTSIQTICVEERWKSMRWALQDLIFHSYHFAIIALPFKILAQMTPPDSSLSATEIEFSVSAFQVIISHSTVGRCCRPCSSSSSLACWIGNNNPDRPALRNPFQAPRIRDVRMAETRVKYSTDESYSRFDNTRSVQVGDDYCCNTSANSIRRFV